MKKCELEELKKYYYTSKAAPYIILSYARGALTYKEALTAIKAYHEPKKKGVLNNGNN